MAPMHVILHTQFSSNSMPIFTVRSNNFTASLHTVEGLSKVTKTKPSSSGNKRTCSRFGDETVVELL